MSLTGASKQWVSSHIEKKGDSFYISWRCLRNLIRLEFKSKKKMCMFALGIYGLVIFPKVGYIEADIIDISGFGAISNRWLEIPTHMHQDSSSQQLKGYKKPT
ncbi:hypothetical protein GQ457_06G000270 [Hibiscus cannabinus]